MAEKDFDYNITTTFYAKWILPIVLIVVGTILIFLFVPALKFTKGLEFGTKNELVLYKITYDGEDKFAEIKSKCVYEEKKSGSNTYYVKYTTETAEEVIYDKHIPFYSTIRVNLAPMGTAGGVGLTVVGIFMLGVNVFNAMTKVSKKKRDAIYASVSENDDEEDEEDDE